MIADGLGKVSEFFLLIFAELGWDFDLNGYIEVAFVSAGEGWHAFVANAEGGAALGAGGDFDRGLAVEGGDFELAAEGCGAERKWDFAEQSVALAFEDIVILDVDEGVEIAGNTATNSCIAVASGTQSHAGIDACWDAEFDASFAFDATLATAIAAGIGDDLACSTAFWAGGLLDENSGLSADYSASAAGAASFYAARTF